MPYVFAAAVLGILGVLVLGAVTAFRKSPITTGIRIALVLLLLAPLPFCVLGFAASFEGGDLWWVAAIVYAVVVVGCLGAIVYLCRSFGSRTSRSHSPSGSFGESQ